MHKFTRIHQVRHIGSINGCVALGACDVAEAVLTGGRRAYVTWGRNLTLDKIDDYSMPLGVAEAAPGVFEMIIPIAVMERLRPVLVLDVQPWRSRRELGWD